MEEIIKELIKSLKEIRVNSFDIQKKLLLESIKTNKLYESILEELRKQNHILNERNIVEVSKY